MDSLAPALRFITLVALFTAAGIWLQTMSTRSATPLSAPAEQPKTAGELPTVPAEDAIAPEPLRPTAAGPLESTPQSGARVGRTDGDDFIGQSDSNRAAMPVDHPTTMPPRFLIANGGHVPRVQTAELPKAQADESPVNAAPNPSNDSEQAPSVARYPGFNIETPTR
jgi:hypothetical protein